MSAPGLPPWKVLAKVQSTKETVTREGRDSIDFAGQLQISPRRFALVEMTEL
jgi:hypothetical protein